MRILDREAEVLESNQGQSFLVRTKRGIPIFNPGTHQGDYSIPVEFLHYDGQTSSIRLDMHVAPLGFLEEWTPFAMTIVILLIVFLLLWGVFSYRPFPRGAMMIKKDKGGTLRWKTRVHPGNRWIFGKASLNVGGGARIEAVGRRRFALVKPDPDSDQKGTMVSEPFDWRIQTVCNGYTAFYFNASKKTRDEVEATLDDALRRHNRIYKSSSGGVELY